jgi:ribosomal protein S1
VAAAEKSIHIDVFGIECSVAARNLSWEWVGSVGEKYGVGDKILVKITEIRGDSVENLTIKATVNDAMPDTRAENMQKCRIQGKYAGKVLDVYKGITFIRLEIGVNAIAHACYDSKHPGKDDTVSFVATRIDSERYIAVGSITKIIKQNV